MGNLPAEAESRSNVSIGCWVLIDCLVRVFRDSVRHGERKVGRHNQPGQRARWTKFVLSQRRPEVNQFAWSIRNGAENVPPDSQIQSKAWRNSVIVLKIGIVVGNTERVDSVAARTVRCVEIAEGASIWRGAHSENEVGETQKAKRSAGDARIADGRRNAFPSDSGAHVVFAAQPGGLFLRRECLTDGMLHVITRTAEVNRTSDADRRHDP